MERRWTSDDSINKSNIIYPFGNQFCSKFAVKLFRAIVVNTEAGSLKSLHTFLKKCLYHMLVKFKRNSLVRTTRILLALWQETWLRPFLIKWHHFGRRFYSRNSCLMLSYWRFYLSVFQKLQKSDTCNKILKLHQTWQTRLVLKTHAVTLWHVNKVSFSWG